jgi:hypothetical protein
MHMPWLLRLAHIKSRITGGDSNVALQESARGLRMWKVRRCLVPTAYRRGSASDGRFLLPITCPVHRHVLCCIKSAHPSSR